MTGWVGVYLWWAALLVGAFLLGGVNPASIVARVLGMDLAQGSGNPGATNAGRVMGMRWGVVVGLADVVKGWLPTVLVVRHYGEWLGAAVAIALVLGHMFSPYLRGRGGKGVATTLGATLALRPWWALVLLGCFAVGGLLLRRVSAGSIVAALALVALGIGIWVREGPSPVALWAVIAGVAVLGRHTSNIRGFLPG